MEHVGRFWLRRIGLSIEVCPRIEFKRWAFAFGFVTGLGGPRAPRRKLWPLRSLSFFFVRDCHTRVWKVDVHLIKSNDPFFLLSSRNDLRPKQHGSWIVQSAVQSTAANSIKKFHTAAWIRKRRPTRYRISPEGREKERERGREREREKREGERKRVRSFVVPRVRCTNYSPLLCHAVSGRLVWK